MTAQTGSAGALEQARAYVGAPCGPLRVGRDPVNLPMFIDGIKELPVRYR